MSPLLHHVSVCVSDLARARRFYGEIVGLRELPRPDLGFPGAWYAVGDAQELHLIVHPPSKTMRRTPEIDGRDGHFAFRVASYDETLARLQAHGVALVESPLNRTPWAQIYVTDPDGNVIEFNVQRAAPSPPAPRLTFAFEMRATVGQPDEVGPVRGGRRRIVPITGGTFEGPGLRGEVLPGGADWQTIQPDGFSDLDTRYTIRTDSGQLIYVQNAGVRHAAPDVMERLVAGQAVDPSLVYFRTVPAFETSAPELQWLARSIFVGLGERYPAEVVIRFFKVE